MFYARFLEQNSVAAPIVFGLILSIYLLKLWTTRPARPLPPGPKGLPILGAIYDVPLEASWKAFKGWRDTWGDIIYFHTLGKKIIVLNSGQAAHDLLDKRSSIYSYRPRFVVANEMIGWKFSLTSMDYGETSRRQRRYLQSYFQRSRLPLFFPLQTKEARTLLVRLLEESSRDIRSEVKTMAAAVTMMLAYGHQVESNDDPFIRIAEKGVATIQAAGVVGGHIIDFIPFLRYVPDWMPGASFKRLPPGTCEDLQKFLHTPFNQVKKEMSDGVALPSYTADLLMQTMGKDEPGVLGTAALIYSGGLDTTMSTLMTAIINLVANPVIQERVQAEMDMVIGEDRLPTFADRDNLPFLHCVISEAIRWGASTPIGVPHRVSEDDMYKGYFIPKDTMIMCNQWGMLHDERVYPEPEVFNPDRFLGGVGHIPQPDPRTVAFGFGRRICPGKDIAENTVWIAVASLFYAFKILPALNPETGERKTVDMEYIEYSVRHPKPFECEVTPRRLNSITLIQESRTP